LISITQTSISLVQHAVPLPVTATVTLIHSEMPKYALPLNSTSWYNDFWRPGWYPIAYATAQKWHLVARPASKFPPNGIHRL